MADGTGLIRRFYEEIIVGGNLDLIDELATDDYVDHEEAMPGQPAGKDGVRYFVNQIRKAFPDLKVKTLEPYLADGNMEACHVVLTGTHQGEMAGVPATGRSVRIRRDRHYPRRGRQGRRTLGIADNMRLMQQIGAIPG